MEVKHTTYFQRKTNLLKKKKKDTDHRSLLRNVFMQQVNTHLERKQ